MARNDDGDEYCKVYLNLDATHEGAKALLSEILGSSVVQRTIETPVMWIDIFKNTARGPSRSNHFIGWPYYLDIGAHETIEHAAFVQSLQVLLDALKARGIAVVAACDFENELTDSLPRPIP